MSLSQNNTTNPLTLLCVRRKKDSTTLQADEILARPMDTPSLVDAITHRVAIGPTRNREIESVGAILDRTTEAAIEEWYGRVPMDSPLMSVPMTCEHRCAHLPRSSVTWSFAWALPRRTAAKSRHPPTPFCTVSIGGSGAIPLRCW
jgi:hypothetical protein